MQYFYWLTAIETLWRKVLCKFEKQLQMSPLYSVQFRSQNGDGLVSRALTLCRDRSEVDHPSDVVPLLDRNGFSLKEISAEGTQLIQSIGRRAPLPVLLTPRLCGALGRSLCHRSSPAWVSAQLPPFPGLSVWNCFALLNFLGKDLHLLL